MVIEGPGGFGTTVANSCCRLGCITIRITTKHYLAMRKLRILIKKIHSRVSPSFAGRHTVNV